MSNAISSVAMAICLVVAARCSQRAAEPEIVSVKRIWDRGKHNAFTDLLRFRDRWWCTFREAEGHGSSIGKVRVITSDDGDDWESAALVEEGDNWKRPESWHARLACKPTEPWRARPVSRSRPLPAEGHHPGRSEVLPGNDRR